MPSIYTANATPQRYIGKCETCQRPVAAPLSDGHNPEHKNITCPDCKGACNGSLVYGVTNRMSCDSRCMGAYGPNCSCACGGANHGGVWSQTLSDVPAEAIQKYRKDVERREEQAKSRREAKKEKTREEFDIWYQNQDSILDDVITYAGDNYFICDIRDMLKRHRIPSYAQVSAVIRTIKRERVHAKADRSSLSKYQGEIGETLTKLMTIDRINWIPDSYAKSYSGQEMPTKPMYIMHDAENNVYVWFTSSAKYALVKVQGSYSAQDVAKAGDTLKIHGTVKEHKEYEGTKQTILTRVKVIFD